MRRRQVSGFSLFFGGCAILMFVFIYSWFGVFPNQSRRGREPILLAEEPDRFWTAVTISLAVAVILLVAALAKTFRR